MARACIEQGFEYLVISDHSKSAFYANGLKEDRIREQHLLIDELNQKLAPFRIFKSIECDILYDGALDYPDTILSSFDLVIVSVHSNLKMSEDKAMMRLLNAISNPYATILGHLTGRLLLSRPGYPVLRNHEQAGSIRRITLGSVAVGALGGGATIAFFVATHHGPLTVTAVITSLYPATTVLLALGFLRERLRRVQTLGAGLAAVAVALLSTAGG